MDSAGCFLFTPILASQNPPKSPSVNFDHDFDKFLARRFISKVEYWLNIKVFVILHPEA